MYKFWLRTLSEVAAVDSFSTASFAYIISLFYFDIIGLKDVLNFAIPLII